MKNDTPHIFAPCRSWKIVELAWAKAKVDQNQVISISSIHSQQLAVATFFRSCIKFQRTSKLISNRLLWKKKPKNTQNHEAKRSWNLLYLFGTLAKCLPPISTSAASFHSISSTPLLSSYILTWLTVYSCRG